MIVHVENILHIFFFSPFALYGIFSQLLNPTLVGLFPIRLFGSSIDFGGVAFRFLNFTHFLTPNFTNKLNYNAIISLVAINMQPINILCF